MFDIHQTPAAAYCVSVDGDVFRFQDCNAAAIAIAGLTTAIHPGLTPHDCFPPPVADAIVARYRACRDTKSAFSYVVEAGDRTWRTTLLPQIDATGRVVALYGVLAEAADERATVRTPDTFKDRPVLALDSIEGGFWVYEIATGAFETSAPLAELLAGPGARMLSLAEYVGHVHEADLPQKSFLLDSGDRSTIEYRVVTHEGRTRWLQSRRRLVRDDAGKPLRIVAMVLDITEQKKAFVAMEAKASTDSLTALRNRRAFDSLGALAWCHARQAQQTIGMLLFDLDGFKPINDRYGHRAGDLILRKLAQRVSRFIRKEDVFARVGGDEFAILLRDGREAAGDVLAGKVRKAFEKPFDIAGAQVLVGVSIGFAVSEPADPSIETLFERADRALYAMKNQRQLLSA